MKDNFDDLSNDFLGEGNDKNKSHKPKGPTIRKGRTIKLDSEDGMPIDLGSLPEGLPPEILNIIKSISDIKERGGNIEDELNLGEPDEFESESKDEDGNSIDKSTWNTDFGSVTRISIGGDIPPNMGGESLRDLFRNKFGVGSVKNPELTLEEKLEKAEEEEDYLECAKIMKEIANKSEKSENSENVDTKRDSEGTFWDDIK